MNTGIQSIHLTDEQKAGLSAGITRAQFNRGMTPSEEGLRLLRLVTHMQAGGSSLVMNWGEDNSLWEVDWITSGKRYRGCKQSLVTALEDAKRAGDADCPGYQVDPS